MMTDVLINNCDLIVVIFLTIIIYISIHFKDENNKKDCTTNCLTSFLSAIGLYASIGLLYYFFTGTILFQSDTLVNPKYLILIAGVTLTLFLGVPIIYNYVPDEYKKVRIKINLIDEIKLSREELRNLIKYNEYIEQTKNVSLIVNKCKDDRFYADTKKYVEYLPEDFIFSLYVMEDRLVGDKEKQVQSPEIAELQLISKSENSIFKLKKWCDVEDKYIEIFKDNAKIIENKAHLKIKKLEYADEIKNTAIHNIYSSNWR